MRRTLTVRFTVDLPHELHKRFKMACVGKEMEMTQAVRKLISDFVKRAEKAGKEVSAQGP